MTKLSIFNQQLLTTILWYILTISKYPVDFVNKPKKIMVRRVKFSLRGECKRKEKAEKISLNFPHRENCCFPITMKNNIFISTWISYPLRSWYVFARAISNQTTVNLEVTVFSQAKHKISESCYLKHQKIDCDVSLHGHLFSL